MSRQASVLVIAAGLLLVTVARPADVNAVQSLQPTSEQRAEYERGRAYQRIVILLQDPSVYFIAALRSRFDDDLMAIESEPDLPSVSAAKMKPAFETVRASLRTGNPSSISPDLAGANYFEPYLTGGSPPNAANWWLVEAGMAEVDLRAAAGNQFLLTMAILHPTWLANHLNDGGDLVSLVPISDLAGKKLPALQSLQKLGQQSEEQTASLDEMTRYEGDLLQNLDNAFPESAYPAITYPPGLLGDARLGVAWATIGELAQQPRLLWQPESQEFIDDFFRQLGNILGDSQARSTLSQARTLLAVGSSPTEEAVKNLLGVEIATLLYSHLPKARTDVIFLGFDAAQAVWETNTKDADEANFDRDWVSTNDSLDQFVPGLSNQRRELGEVKSGDWIGLIGKAQAVVNAILR